MRAFLRSRAEPVRDQRTSIELRCFYRSGVDRPKMFGLISDIAQLTPDVPAGTARADVSARLVDRLPIRRAALRKAA